jgi:cysteinyl-tRNA synthetase
MTLYLYNTLTRKKEAFKPIDAGNVRMYVCGPTVYDRPHIGNARSVVVYDVLFRLLNHLYGPEHVTYARNITDVDDKINTRAKELKIPIQQLTAEVTGWFHADMKALGNLNPTHEPRATVHIPVMIAIIEQLLENRHAYVQDGHVLFDVTSYAAYGALSGRKIEEQVAGARVEVEAYKKHPGDFVLWKPAEKGDDPSSVFDSPWGAGRPGWHIECSAMSSSYLGHEFDIHGGGADLMFPHHENEIAQSRCADKEATFAHVWVHNGFLTVNGEKMSKSLGNFITVNDLLPPAEDETARKNVGENIRLALLTTKYSEPLDWSSKLLEDAKLTLNKWYRKIPNRHPDESRDPDWIPASAGMTAFTEALCDDLNLPKAFSLMHTAGPEELYAMGKLLGLFGMTADERFKSATIHRGVDDEIEARINARQAAKKAKNWAEADRIRKELAEKGILLEDRPDGSTDWRRA